MFIVFFILFVGLKNDFFMFMVCVFFFYLWG